MDEMSRVVPHTFLVLAVVVMTTPLLGFTQPSVTTVTGIQDFSRKDKWTGM